MVDNNFFDRVVGLECPTGDFFKTNPYPTEMADKLQWNSGFIVKLLSTMEWS